MIEVRDVRLTRGGAAALAGASLRLDRGEVVALAGANGSGKSTLGRLIAGGMLADAGSVRVDGIDPAASAGDRARVRRLVGVVGQDPLDQIVAMTVGDEVAFGPRNLRLPEREVEARVREALELAGLSGRERVRVGELSGGELVRVALAGMLAMHPGYLVLDEVGAMLDGALRVQVRSLVRSLAAAGAGILVITHDPADIAAADRVAVLESGSVSWAGPPRALVEGNRPLWDRVTGDDGLARAVADRLGAAGAVEQADAAFGAEPDGRCVRATGRGRRARGVGDIPRVAGPERRSPDIMGPVPGSLVLAGVSYTYPGGAHPAIDQVDLAIAPGEILLLAGVSGSGKSTLASLAAGLVAPGAGSVRRDGRPVHPGEVGLAAQRPEAQLFLERVDDEVAFGPCSLGVAEEGVARRVEGALTAVGLDRGLAARHPLELSGGQRRRVGTAAVLALEPVAYIFDEPTAGLDAAGRSEAHRTARRLAAAGAPVLVISHDLDEWIDDADALALIADGVLVWRGSRDDALAHPDIWARAGLTLPVTLGGAIEAPLRAGEGEFSRSVSVSPDGAATGLATSPRPDATTHPDGVTARRGEGPAPTAPISCGTSPDPAPTAPMSAPDPAPAPPVQHRPEPVPFAAVDPAPVSRPPVPAPTAAAAPAPTAAPAPARRPPLDARVKLILFLVAAIALFASSSPLVIGGGALALALAWATSRRASRPRLTATTAVTAHPAPAVGPGTATRPAAAAAPGAPATPRPAAAVLAPAAPATPRPAPTPRPPALPLLTLACLVLTANLVSCDGTAPVALVGPVGLDPARALASALALARLAVLLGLALTIAATVSVPALSAAFVRLMSPLAALRVPVGALSGALSIALTSIPQVVEEFRRIELAQRARGARLDEGPLATQIRLRAAIVVPVVLALLRRADRLGEAMAARSFDPDVVQVPPRPLSSRDTMVLVGGTAFAALVLALASLAPWQL